MPPQANGFDRSVPLPPELKITHIREAIEHVESKASELIDIYFEQANVFSGVVGILGEAPGYPWFAKVARSSQAWTTNFSGRFCLCRPTTRRLPTDMHHRP